VPNQVVCHLALTTFPLAFQDLGQLQREYSVLAYIIVKLEIGDKFDNYSLSEGTLYCRSNKGRGLWFLPPQNLWSSLMFF